VKLAELNNVSRHSAVHYHYDDDEMMSGDIAAKSSFM